MTNTSENNLPIWFFFSDVDATAINESGRKVEDGFSYSSGNNTEWLSVEDIRKLLETLDLEK